MNTLSRRRFLSVSAAFAATGFLGGSQLASAQISRWQGIALGAQATLHFAGLSPEDSRTMITDVRAEIQRLEAIFSLYDSQSQISKLNRNQTLNAPAFELISLLSAVDHIHHATGGAFDPTVQSAWQANAEHFTSSADRSVGIASTATSGWQHVRFDAKRVSFTQPMMAITLNGIAQGYITDRICDLLRSNGLENILVNMGEHRALGPQRAGTGWPVRLRENMGGQTVRLSRRALSSSHSLGTTFDAAGAVGHLIDPQTRMPSRSSTFAAVEASTSAVADGLSTAFCVMNPAAINAALQRFPDARQIV
jgi:thiamine biosynthesis lipoprotein